MGRIVCKEGVLKESTVAMRVLCREGKENVLTEGKVYMGERRGDYIVLENDIGKRQRYPLHRFLPAEETSNIPIGDIRDISSSITISKEEYKDLLQHKRLVIEEEIEDLLQEIKEINKRIQEI